MFQDLKFGLGYCESGNLEFLIMANLILTPLLYILAKVTSEYSWMDRLWMILPNFYSLHFVMHPHLCNGEPISHKKVLMAALIFVWGVRLLFHFIRKGLFSKSGEDYRWTYIKKNRSPIYVEMLLIFMISFYQPMLLVWMASPVYSVSNKGLSQGDVVLALITLAVILMESIADNQQNDYFKEKQSWEKRKDKKDAPARIKRGFLTDGLFRNSRHPNYFAEIAFWWCIYGFSVLDSGLNLTGLGALQLTLVFQKSISITEHIANEKYKGFREYQKGVSQLVPLPSTYNPSITAKEE